MQILSVSETAKRLGLNLGRLNYLILAQRVPEPHRSAGGRARFYLEEDLQGMKLALKEKRLKRVNA